MYLILLFHMAIEVVENVRTFPVQLHLKQHKSWFIDFARHFINWNALHLFVVFFCNGVNNI